MYVLLLFCVVYVLAQLLEGNDNTFTAALREIRPPIIARSVRIVPYSRHRRTVCMRVELYGCTWTGASIFNCVVCDVVVCLHVAVMAEWLRR